MCRYIFPPTADVPAKWTIDTQQKFTQIFEAGITSIAQEAYLDFVVFMIVFFRVAIFSTMVVHHSLSALWTQKLLSRLSLTSGQFHSLSSQGLVVISSVTCKGADGQRQRGGPAHLSPFYVLNSRVLECRESERTESKKMTPYRL